MPASSKSHRSHSSDDRHSESFFEELKPGQFLEALFEALPNAHLFIKDSERRFIAASEGFARQMGVKRVSDLLGKTDHDFTPRFIADAFVKDDLLVLRTGNPILQKVELVPSQNSLDWLTTSKIPLYGHSGKIIGLAGVIRKTEDSDEIYRENPVVHRIVDFIGTHYPKKIAVLDMASHAGISASTVERVFRETFGISPLKYVKKVRLHCACKMLRTTKKSLGTISKECGFTDPTSMSRDFRLELKINPRSYRNSFGKKKLSAPRRKVSS
jgi:AraC-like DNA-binding protein